MVGRPMRSRGTTSLAGHSLGKPLGPANAVGAGQWTREFEHVSVAIDTKALTASVIWKPSNIQVRGDANAALSDSGPEGIIDVEV